jgi:hypothetical protein
MGRPPDAATDTLPDTAHEAPGGLSAWKQQLPA